MSALSSKIQNAVVILVTSLYAQQSDDDVTKCAADTVCRELRRKITGKHATDKDFRQMTELGGRITNQGWMELQGVMSSKIMMAYT